MIHSNFPCTYTNFFSDAQLEDENPNLHPGRRALLSYVRPIRRHTLPFTSSRITTEEDAFGDDEDSDREDSSDDEFWDCEHIGKVKHPSLQVTDRLKSVDRFAILACLDVNPDRIRTSILKDETTSDDGQDETSDYSESDLSAYTASEGVESPSSLVTSQDLWIETTSVHDLSHDGKCVATHSLRREIGSITLSDNEDDAISSDDDSLFAQYGTLLPFDRMPEKYKRYYVKRTKPVSPASNTHPSVPRGCYRVVDFIHANGFSEVVVAQSMAEDEKGSILEKGRVCCIKIYRNSFSVSMPEGVRPELRAETKAYQRLSEEVRRKLPGFLFLMKLEALLHDDSRTFLIMDVMSYPLHAVIEDLPWALNRVQETKRLVAQMALGLATLHSVGIIHRDFKPGNILIDYRGNVRIADFGSSKVSNRCAPYLPGGSYAHACVGTWPYIAPEVLGNERTQQVPYGIEVDYWSLGCIVFELESVYGEVMFNDRTQFHLWCSLEDQTGKQKFLEFGELRPHSLSLVCGLVHSDVHKRFGLFEIIHHPYFGKAENSEFYFAQDRALRRTFEGSAEIDVSALDDTDDESHFVYL